MSVEFYTVPSLTMDRLKETLPEGHLLCPPLRPRYIDTRAHERGERDVFVEQYLVVCPDGSRIWAFVCTMDGDNHRPGAVRFESFGSNNAVAFLEALEKSAGVKVFDEYDLDLEFTVERSVDRQASALLTLEDRIESEHAGADEKEGGTG